MQGLQAKDKENGSLAGSLEGKMLSTEALAMCVRLGRDQVGNVHYTGVLVYWWCLVLCGVVH